MCQHSLILDHRKNVDSIIERDIWCLTEKGTEHYGSDVKDKYLVVKAFIYTCQLHIYM